MSRNERDTAELTTQMEELRLQEEKLVQLKRRLLRLPPADSESRDGPDETASFLVVTHAKQHFAIAVECVDEVFEMVSVMGLAKRPPGVVGLVDYHGAILVLLDLGEIAGAGRSNIHPDNIIVICNLNGARFGLMVEASSDVVTVEKRHIKAADAVMSGILRELGMVQLDQTTAAIIDLYSALLTIQLNAADLSLPVAALDDHPQEEHGA